MIKRTYGMIVIKTRKVGIPFPLFSPESENDGEEESLEICDEEVCEDLPPEEESEAEEIELTLEGKLVVTGERAELVWQESELTGMEGATTKLGFSLAEPGLMSMLRSGSVNTALIFETGKRHFCIYHTLFSAFEVCVQGITVDNRLLTDGTVLLDYLIELKGNRTERCRMQLSFHAAP